MRRWRDEDREPFADMNADPVVMEHFGNAYVRKKGGHRLVRKEHDQSARKIDSVVAAALAYEARADAIADGLELGTGKVEREPGVDAHGKLR